MDIDEFLDREFSNLGLKTDKAEPSAELPQFKEDFEQSPLFENIKSNLSKGDLEQAEQAYVQLWHILLQQKLKWNKELYEQLSILSKQFSTALNYAYNDVKKKADGIYALIGQARNALKEGKKDAPFKIYSEIYAISNSTSNVFFEEKKVIEEQIMDFYKELRNATDNELVKRVATLMQDINHLIDKVNVSIRSNNMINAIVSYNKCIELYNQVPEGFLKHKNSIGIRILDIYKSLSIYTEMSNLQKQLNQQGLQQIQVPQQQGPISTDKFAQMTTIERDARTKSMLLSAKKERAKKYIEKGFYNEASKDIQEALQLEPNDAEAKAIHAKIKTLQ